MGIHLPAKASSPLPQLLMDEHLHGLTALSHFSPAGADPRGTGASAQQATLRPAVEHVQHVVEPDLGGHRVHGDAGAVGGQPVGQCWPGDTGPETSTRKPCSGGVSMSVPSLLLGGGQNCVQ